MPKSPLEQYLAGEAGPSGSSPNPDLPGSARLGLAENTWKGIGRGLVYALLAVADALERK